MSKMSEMDMMVSEAIEMHSQDDMELGESVAMVAVEWALDDEEYIQVWQAAAVRMWG